ncbi:MAG TPA: hypothetical protein VKX16_19575 [Chloroflexota bacterium]|nr:hypothetical protein [Chloroflexota bacterium]
MARSSSARGKVGDRFYTVARRDDFQELQDHAEFKLAAAAGP